MGVSGWGKSLETTTAGKFPGIYPYPSFSLNITTFTETTAMTRYILLMSATFFVFCAAAQNVGIGTTTPVASLDVIGTLKITDGSQGANKILTSNAAGLATWSDAPPPACFLFSSNTSIGANDYLGQGVNGSNFIRNTIVAPFNCELTSITLSGRGTMTTLTATVYKSAGHIFPAVPINTGLTTTITSVVRFSSGIGSVFVNKGDLISVQISAGAIDGAAVGVTYR
jgi:hypothetical protein